MSTLEAVIRPNRIMRNRLPYSILNNHIRLTETALVPTITASIPRR